MLRTLVADVESALSGAKFSDLARPILRSGRR